MKKTILGLFLFTFLQLSVVSPVFAISTPSFPSCANPQGVVRASYSEGVHGIVGSSATYTGSDAVYTLSDDTVTQCFCSVDGAGIQTNWWKASSLSSSSFIFASRSTSSVIVEEFGSQCDNAQVT